MRGRRRLVHAAKISDYRFRKMLWHFVLDHSATDTARATGLSINSTNILFRKLRVFFYETHLFTDIYGGQDPTTLESDNPVFERDLIEFHFRRVREKRGVRSPWSEPDYHFAESHWRYHFHVLMAQRPSDRVHAMMFGHLLEIIRLCGPVSKKPMNRRAGLLAVMRQMDQRILWLERNAPRFRADSLRQELKEIREI